MKMILNETNIKLLKRRGYRYLVVQKPTNYIRSTYKDLKNAVFEVFGFSMSNVSIGLYDTILDKFLEQKEYKNEMQEVLEHQKEMGWLL